MRVLIIGGYGNFGGRLVDLLRDEERLTLIVAGRDLVLADRFCDARQGSAATVLAARFDRVDPQRAMAELQPDVVVDAAGPFQLYGSDPYRTARAALAYGASYVDLADGRDFVRGITSLDADAKAAGKFALAGASSFPALTAAVVRTLRAFTPEVDSIVGGIAPSPFARVGFNVIRAIASYAGKPLRVLSNGQWTTLYGLISSRRLVVAPDGCDPLPPIRFSLVDVPDLAVLAEDWPEAKTIWMGAGPTPAVMHRLLWLASWCVRLRLVPSLLPFAPLMDWAVNTFR
jgi:saccharopine dehydrogenase-like NADP-dependent oxidoreductase